MISFKSTLREPSKREALEGREGGRWGGGKEERRGSSLKLFYSTLFSPPGEIEE